MCSVEINQLQRRQLLFVRAVQAIFLSSAIVSIPFWWTLSLLGFEPSLKDDNSAVFIVTTILGLFTTGCLATGMLWPRLTGWYKEPATANTHNDTRVLLGHIFRIALFESVVAYATVLQLLGGLWYVSLPPLVLGTAALILTFPTDSRWAQWHQRDSAKVNPH
ncbi:MAG: hypothetical protein AB1597_09570 [Chloroflexota bacterium]